MNGFLGNDAFIDAVRRPLDLADSRAVFDYVFSALPGEVRVYPTEGYYYFTFAADGATVWGSLSLYAHNRDQGILGFGYALKTDKYRDVYRPVAGGGATLTARDGVIVDKVAELTYRVICRGKTVVFTLHMDQLQPPPRECLRDDEVYVGPSYDESGLRFYLIFNSTANCVYWVLNRTYGDRVTCTPLTADLVIEDRTEYAFYLDNDNDRMILVGVEGFNVLQNNWYDGPFDQMPDNYVYTGQIEVQKYLEASYPYAKGRIDRYGNYLAKPGSRIAVAPYLVYFYRADLVRVIEECKAAGLEGAAFLAGITRQAFEVPPEFRPLSR